MDEKLFLEGDRQKILDAMKGQDSEMKLITLLPPGFMEKLRNKYPDADDENIEDRAREKFQKQIDDFIKGTLKEKKNLSREEMEQLLVRKILDLANPNSEYDIFLFQKVKKLEDIFVYGFTLSC